METLVVSNDGNLAVVAINADRVEFRRPEDTTEEVFRADFVVGQPLNTDKWQCQQMEEPWIFVPGDEVNPTSEVPVKAKVTGVATQSKPGQPKATTHSDCQPTCKNTPEGAWHEWPCPHMIDVLLHDPDMHWDTVTGQMTPRTKVN